MNKMQSCAITDVMSVIGGKWRVSIWTRRPHSFQYTEKNHHRHYNHHVNTFAR